jgi:hypothetical protein
MTSEGSEPRLPDAPPPPPPPPDLAPPPGYTAYSQNLSTSVDLKRVGGLAKAIVILLAVYAVGELIRIAGMPGVVDSAKEFKANPGNDDAFLEDVGTFVLMGALSQAAMLAIIVLSIIWTYRIVKNHRVIGRTTTWGPGMAIGGWFLPPFLYVIPTLVLREAWKAADPTVPPGDERWKRGKDNPLLWAWFLVYGVGTVVLSIISSSLQFRQLGGEADDLADAYADNLGVMIALSVLGLVSAVLWALLVRQWTARHTTLTGEAGA